MLRFGPAAVMAQGPNVRDFRNSRGYAEAERLRRIYAYYYRYYYSGHYGYYYNYYYNAYYDHYYWIAYARHAARLGILPPLRRHHHGEYTTSESDDSVD